MRTDLICREITRKATTTTAARHEISLEDMPVDDDDGSELCLLSLVVDMPNAAVALATSKVMDGASLAQLLALVTLEMAEDAPPSEAGGRTIIDAVPGYQALMALHLLSGRAVFEGFAARSLRFLSVGTADDTDNKNATAPTVQCLEGPLQFQGPFGTADGTSTSAYSTATRIYLPVGYDQRERPGTNSIPARYFVGQRRGEAAKQSSGKLVIDMGSKIDDATITWTAGEIVVSGIFERRDPRKLPVPTTPVIRRKNENGTQFKIAAGIQEAFILLKDIEADGDVATHSYTRVQARYGAKRLNDADLSLDIHRIRDRMPDNWPVQTTDDALTHAPQDRYIRTGVPIFANFGPENSVLDAPGGFEKQPTIHVQTTGETGGYMYLQITRTPRTPQVNHRAIEYNGGKGRVFPNTRNGNALPPAFAKAWDPLLPGIIVS